MQVSTRSIAVLRLPQGCSGGDECSLAPGGALAHIIAGPLAGCVVPVLR